MLFNSISFAIFLPVVFCLYWFITNKSLKLQNLLLLAASYFFYSCWDVRFLSLLIFSTLLDYFSGIKMFEAKNPVTKKIWFWTSVCINLGFLCFFKYYNFFVESFSTAVAQTGYQINPWTIKLILPIGISFYTFHGLSYIIDIYEERIEPERNFISYSLFVSFFPLLVAGPIERATHLLPQIKEKRSFSYAQAAQGLKQILWGLFKKIAIADQCATYVNMVYANPLHYNGSTHVLGAILFAFQIYCDFSGYSDIALGTAKLFGIELMVNFNRPYLSKTISEYWRRWHISLSSWLNDYVYNPLALKYRRLKKAGVSLALFITFFISGLWHGAGWTFILYGVFHGVAIIYEIYTKKIRKSLFEKLPEALNDLITRLLILTYLVLTWVFFRAPGLREALQYISKIFSASLFSKPIIDPLLFCSVFVFIIAEYIYFNYNQLSSNLRIIKYRPVKWVVYYLLVMCICYFAGGEQTFIYFQF